MEEARKEKELKLEEMKKSFEKQVQDLQNENEALKSECKAKEASSQQREMQVKANEESKKQISQQIAATELKATAERDRMIDALKAENEKKVSTLKSDHEKSMSQLKSEKSEELNTMKRDFEKQLSQLKAELEKSTASNTQTQSKVNSLQKDMSKLQTTLDSTKAQLKDAEKLAAQPQKPSQQQQQQQDPLIDAEELIKLKEKVSSLEKLLSSVRSERDVAMEKVKSDEKSSSVSNDITGFLETVGNALDGQDVFASDIPCQNEEESTQKKGKKGKAEKKQNVEKKCIGCKKSLSSCKEDSNNNECQFCTVLRNASKRGQSDLMNKQLMNQQQKYLIIAIVIAILSLLLKFAM